MNTRKFLLAVLAGFVGNIVAFFLLEEIILKSYMATVVYKPAGAVVGGSPVLPPIGVLVLTLIMAYIYPKGYEGGSPVTESLRFGILLGLFFGLPFALFFGELFPIVGFGPILVLALVGTLEVATNGLLIGLVYGRIQQSKA